jgi:hypothetical protein
MFANIAVITYKQRKAKMKERNPDPKRLIEDTVKGGVTTTVAISSLNVGTNYG